MSTITSRKRGISFPDNVDAIALGRFNILALSGGGYRGLFGAHVLSQMETRFSASISNEFQLLAGTSIGGIVACALAVGIPAAEVLKTFKEHGEKIFPAGLLSPIAGFMGAKYSAGPLEKVIKEILGEHAKVRLKDVKQPLMLPTVCINDSAPMILKSGGLANDVFSSEITVLEAAMATSAAPTYFPSRTFKNRSFVDGGLIANAPDVAATTEAIKLCRSLDDIYMLSIGTCGRPARKSLGEPVKAGKLGWILKHDLVDLTLSAQEQLTVEMMELLLGQRYLRIDANASEGEKAVIGLDKANVAATKTLEDLAVRAMEGLSPLGSQQLGDFFN